MSAFAQQQTEMLDHYDYGELDECPCLLCARHRVLLSEVVVASVPTVGHPMDCRCEPCRTRLKLARIALAWSNRRDAYCEIAFLVRDKAWRKSILEWMFNEVSQMHDPETGTGRSQHWWIYRSEEKSLAEWIEDWMETLPGLRKRMSGSRALISTASRRKAPQNHSSTVAA